MRTKHSSTLKGKLGEEEFARATLCLAGALLEEERMHPSEACPNPPLHHELFADRF